VLTYLIEDYSQFRIDRGVLNAKSNHVSAAISILGDAFKLDPTHRLAQKYSGFHINGVQGCRGQCLLRGGFTPTPRTTPQWEPL
jgi:hypothetical protein